MCVETALGEVIPWAEQQGVTGVLAGIDPANTASQNLVRKLGFVEAERHRHEVLGEQIRYRRTFSRRSPAAAP